MPISFTCPHCGHHTEVDEHYAGRSGPCVQCGQPVTVPPLAVAASEVPPSQRFALRIFLMAMATLGGLFLLGSIALFLRHSARGAAREVSPQAQCANHLKQIALAMHDYHDAHKTFPPAYVADAEGRPMCSWRALLLPYIDPNVAERYHYDQPWDSPANRTLIEAIPEVFRCPKASDAAGRETNYVMIVGPGMLSDGTSSTSLDQITDGPSNTILLVEVAGSGIGWTEPRDLEADKISFAVNDSQTLGISSRHRGGAHVALCDGAVQVLSNNADAMRLKEACTIAGGETVDLSKLQQ